MLRVAGNDFQNTHDSFVADFNLKLNNDFGHNMKNSLF